MIFLTVGTQMPFDRLVKAMDQWAERNPHIQLFGQIGPSSYEPAHFQWTSFLDADLFAEKVDGAGLIVAHAGMGSILSALQIGKPILIFPRRADLNEHRNDHQMATANRFKDHEGVLAAFNEQELHGCLDKMDVTEKGACISPFASQELINALREFINK